MGILELANMIQNGDIRELWDVAKQTHLTFNMVTFVATCLVLAVAAATYIFTRQRPVYLMHFTVYKPPAELKTSIKEFLHQTRRVGRFDKKSIEFQEKVVERAGLGDETYLPPCLLLQKPIISMDKARWEAEMVLYGTVETVLKATGLKPQAIDILIVNCSLFNPTPSLSAMIVNKFKMRSNIITYNLGGMGCSAGVIAIGLAQQLLQVYPRSRALVVSTENITLNWYFGNDRSMLISNCLFRIGCSGALLSNRRSDRFSAKYELQHVVRTHMGQDDAHFNCVVQKEDDAGINGISLSKDLMKIAGYSLKNNITTLGPLVLPISEQLLFFAVLVARKVGLTKMKPYIPDFKLAFEHFCIHTGGRGVLDAIEKQLILSPDIIQPSRETLHRYGNISASSVWYVLANIETKRGVKKGDRVWQIAFGSGFKCNSAVWKALRDNQDRHSAWLEE